MRLPARPEQPGRVLRLAAVTLLAGLLVLPGWTVWATTGDPEDVPAPQPTNLPPDEDVHRVVLMPPLDLTAEHPEQLHLASQLLHLGLARYGRFELFGGRELIDRLMTSEQYQMKDLGLAREFARMGQQEYARIRLKDAIAHLSYAVQSFDALAHDLIQPQEVVQAQLALGRAYLENGDPAAADLVFSRLLLVQPTIRLPPGHYSDAVIALLDRVRYRVVHDRSISAERANKALEVAHRTRADYVMLTTLRPAATNPTGQVRALAPTPGLTGPVLGVVVYDVKRRLPLAPEEEIPLAPEQELVVAADWLTSRLAACIPNTVWLNRLKQPPQHRYRLTFDTSFQHLLFFEDPLQSRFHNFGVASGISYLPTEHLLLQARLSFTTSRNNQPYQDLLDPVNLIRLVLGAGIAVARERFTLYTLTGFDLGLRLNFRWTLDPDCKWSEPTPASCVIHQEATGPVLGLHVGLGGHWVFAPPLLLRVRAGFSYLLLPGDKTEFNLPFDWELGLGYRF